MGKTATTIITCFLYCILFLKNKKIIIFVYVLWCHTIYFFPQIGHTLHGFKAKTELIYIPATHSIKSKQHTSQFSFPISISVSDSFNNIWRYMLAQKRREHRGNRYFKNWNELFTAFAIGFMILHFIIISARLNFITLLLLDMIYSGILSLSMQTKQKCYATHMVLCHIWCSICEWVREIIFL